MNIPKTATITAANKWNWWELVSLFLSEDLDCIIDGSTGEILLDKTGHISDAIIA